MESNKISKSDTIFESKIRPISPHLLIYKPQLTSTLSIFHRISGSLLSVAILLVVIFTKFNGYFSSYYPLYEIIQFFDDRSNWIVSTILFMLLLSFYYHLLNGIRHLMWDLGYGLDIKTLYKTGYLVILLSLTLTIITWVISGLIF